MESDFWKPVLVASNFWSKIKNLILKIIIIFWKGGCQTLH